MNTTWKWDASHVFILLGLLLGFSWGGYNAVEALAAANNLNAGTVFPLAMAVATAFWGFWKTPPQSLAAAIQAGEAVLGGGTAQKRGFARLTLLLTIVGLGVAVLVGRALAACTPAQTNAIATVIPPATSCLSTVASLAIQGDSIDQILASLPTGCELTAEDIISYLLGSARAEVQATSAYREAKARRGL